MLAAVYSRRWQRDHDGRARGVVNFEYRVALAGEAPQVIAETTSPHEPPTTMASRLEQAKKDLQSLLGKVSKLVQ